MFIELGEALMKRELWEKALDCFAPINEEESVSHHSVLNHTSPLLYPHSPSFHPKLSGAEVQSKESELTLTLV